MLLVNMTVMWTVMLSATLIVVLRIVDNLTVVLIVMLC